ncbi:sigma-70 family RNA polymerase sigma factor [Oceanobacillus sp. CFH 90083]|uniref:sigma-70 family RNA polymerase sigma factor n=1 Tax=Oceanobacillus sp. CFH 90083 TaxID=2592336 RepID=UPI00128E2224|nr:sigma-70 family RNA polymerase sigma factor [Oceanobacillus sp. CFH 90083]
MKKQLDLQEMEKAAWPLKKEFLHIIEEYRSDLWRYCRYLTGSPWDAEDLVQETLMKAFASLGQIWQPLIPKNYLFRIATNTWLNQQRKNKFITDEFMEEIAEGETLPAAFEVTEAIETLVQHLPLRQVVIVLLVDVFHFTARETAEMIITSEGAVKSALHRARAKLKKISTGEENKMESRLYSKDYLKDSNSKTIHAFVDAFNRRDPDAMAALLDEHAYHDIIHVGQEYGRETIRKYSITDDFKDPTIHQQHAEFRMLWDRPVMAVFIKQDAELQLHDIIYLETEQDKIIYFRHYYFCTDFLTAAANEFKMTIQSERAYKMD